MAVLDLLHSVMAKERSRRSRTHWWFLL